MILTELWKIQIEEAEHVTNKVGKSFRVLDAFLSDLECDSELPAEDFDEDDLDAVELQLQVECSNSGVVVKNSPLHERGLFANKYLPKDTKFNYFGELQLMNKKQDGVYSLRKVGCYVAYPPWCHSLRECL